MAIMVELVQVRLRCLHADVLAEVEGAEEVPRAGRSADT